MKTRGGHKRKPPASEAGDESSALAAAGDRTTRSSARKKSKAAAVSTASGAATRGLPAASNTDRDRPNSPAAGTAPQSSGRGSRGGKGAGSSSSSSSSSREAKSTPVSSSTLAVTMTTGGRKAPPSSSSLPLSPSHGWDEYVANQEDDENESAHLRQMAAENDPALASRNALPDVWHYACGIGLCTYVTCVSTFKSYPDMFGDAALLPDERYQNVSWMSCTGLLVAAFKNCMAISNSHHLDRKRRSVLNCMLMVNCISAHAHYLIATGALPVWRSCFGRTMHAARWSEWTALVTLMMIVTVALDCDSKRAIVRGTLPQSLSVIFGLASTLTCQLGGDAHHCSVNFPSLYGSHSSTAATSAYEPSDDHAAMSDDAASTAGSGDGWSFQSNVLPAERSMGFELGVCALVVSCLFYCDIFRICRVAIFARLHTAASAQAVLLALACTFTWSTFVVVFMMGCLNLSWFNDYVESCMYTATDVLAKIMYAEVLSGVHLSNLSPEEWYKAELVLRERANEAQRHFLRCV
jgi:hypothetical protein